MSLDACIVGSAADFCISYGFMLACLFLGAIAGFLAGLLGVGGGIVIVPVLFALLSNSGMDTALALKMTLATSLSTIIFTSMAAIKAQLPYKSIVWPIVKRWTPFILLGSFSTAFVAEYFSSEWLKTFIGCFLLFAGIVMLLRWKPSSHRAAQRNVPGPIGTILMSFGVGFISALAGIGGGNIIVPLLSWFNIPMKNTTATSSTLGLPIALFGSAGFVISGLDVAQLPEFSLGYVYLPALVLIASMTFLCAPLGVRVAHKVPSAQLKQGFGVLLLLVAVKMLM